MPGFFFFSLLVNASLGWERIVDGAVNHSLCVKHKSTPFVGITVRPFSDNMTSQNEQVLSAKVKGRIQPGADGRVDAGIVLAPLSNSQAIGAEIA